MKSKLKRIISIALATATLFAIAIPVNAQSRASTYKSLRLAYSPERLAAGGPNVSLYQNADVIMMNYSSTDTNQQWSFTSTPNGTMLLNRKGASQGLALNVNNSNLNANVHTWQDNSPADYVISRCDGGAASIGGVWTSVHGLVLTLHSGYLRLHVPNPGTAWTSVKWSYDTYTNFAEYDA